jgi:DNA-binding PadR family transcriptional regulator
MSPIRRRANPLALAVLSCLNERPMHPYEISTTLRTRGKEESIKLNYGSLYAVVESLAKHGLVRPLETTREGRRPQRTVYEITEAGVAEHDDWLAELLSTPVREFTSLEAGLSLMAGLEPDEVARLLAERAERLRLELAGIEATHKAVAEAGLPRIFLVESEYREHLLNAELEYVASLADDIRTGNLHGTDIWRKLHQLRATGMTFEEIVSDPVRHLGEEARVLEP